VLFSHAFEQVQGQMRLVEHKRLWTTGNDLWRSQMTVKVNVNRVDQSDSTVSGFKLARISSADAD
jgi:hypothetical protein